MDLKYGHPACGVMLALWYLLQLASGHYYGIEIGKFALEDSTQLGARGTVYAVDESKIFIKGFTFDGNQFGTDAHFVTGWSDAPDATWMIIPDEMGTTASLGMYFQQDVLLVLPSGMEITEFFWIAIWDVSHEVHYGYVNISRDFKPPQRHDLGPSASPHLDYYFHADNVIMENIKQVTFIGVNDGLKAGTSIYAGNGSPDSPNWKVELQLKKDEGSKLPYTPSVNLTVTLPGDLTVYDVDFIWIWSRPEADLKFDVITITDRDRKDLPPYIPDTTETKSCELLLDSIYQVSWLLDEYNNKITLELSGRVAANEYMAFGISGSETRTQMVGSDVTVVWIDPSTNEPQAEDYHLSANTQCIVNSGMGACPDTFTSEGSNDVHLIGAVIRDGITTITVERPLTSDDPLDKPIPTDKPVYISWSLGFINNVGLASHHHESTSGDLQIDFGATAGSVCPKFEVQDEERRDSKSLNVHPSVKVVPSITDHEISKRATGPANIEACCTFPCQNGGVGFFTADQQSQCVCPLGYFGDQCQLISNACFPNPCQNGGLCIITFGSFLCSCVTGFTGTACDFIDGGPFAVVCPTDVLVLAMAGSSQTVAATWREPDAPGIRQILRSHAPGDSFVIGVTPVSYTFDSAQGPRRCDFCVTVQQVGIIGNPPSVSNCMNLEVTSPQPGMVVTFTEPTANDGCGPIPLLTSASGRSGNFFPVGQHVLTFRFQDSCANEAVCSFFLTVRDICDPNPCRNGGSCLGVDSSNFDCQCLTGFAGPTCSLFVLDICDPNPCRNGGNCLGGDSSNFDCQCPAGFSGPTCSDIDRDVCNPTPCLNGGTCFDVVFNNNEFFCLCPVGFSGTICENRDVCNPTPCLNGGTCFDDVFNNNDFLCQCPVGFSGTICENRDLCNPTPCLNGGTCYDVFFNNNNFFCLCPVGFSGRSCENPDVCNPNPCLNGGTCFDGVFSNDFSCQCPVGFSGRSCEQSLVCNPNPCLNGGTCIDSTLNINGFFCVCLSGYEGTTCEESLVCNPNPCLNGGICIDSPFNINGFFCVCLSGYEGTTCEENPDVCNPNPCLNGGTCFDSYLNNNNFFCLCQFGRFGTTCEQISASNLCGGSPCAQTQNPCSASPCKNGGTCTDNDDDNDNDFSCECPAGFSGTTCTEAVNPCTPNPCENSGTCTDDGDDNFSCECPAAFSGTTCTESEP